jgi:hypothetical protein
LFKDIAQVKSAKISTAPVFKIENVKGRFYKHIDISVPPVSNGYGFVCFNEMASNIPEGIVGPVGVLNTVKETVVVGNPQTVLEGFKVNDRVQGVS